MSKRKEELLEFGVPTLNCHEIQPGEVFGDVEPKNDIFEGPSPSRVPLLSEVASNREKRSGPFHGPQFNAAEGQNFLLVVKELWK